MLGGGVGGAGRCAALEHDGSDRAAEDNGADDGADQEASAGA
jgi:hypothetical protein